MTHTDPTPAEVEAFFALLDAGIEHPDWENLLKESSTDSM